GVISGDRTCGRDGNGRGAGVCEGACLGGGPRRSNHDTSRRIFMIAPMDRVEIVCLRSILEKVTLFLQLQGILHIEEVPLAVENAPDLRQRAHWNDDQRARAEALESIRHRLHEITPLLTVTPSREEVLAASRPLCDRDL